MKRAAFVVIGATTTLLLAGCGNETVTASETQQGITVQVVVTSDSTAIDALKQSLPSTAPGVTFSSGDTHTAPHVCGFSTSKNGHSYQVDFYGNLPSGTSALVCSASAQQEFLADAP